MPTKTISTIADLSSVQMTVVVRYSWRALVASWLIRLGAWVGGAAVTFKGSEDV